MRRCSRSLLGLVVLAWACKVPSTLGLPCLEDAHCDAGQFCGADGTCELGEPPATGSSSGVESGSSSSTGELTTSSTGTGSTGTSSVDPSDTASSSSTGPACGRAIGLCDHLDVLFVVDNSGSMQDELTALVPAFTNFNDLLEDVVGGFCTYHIGVTSTEIAPDYQPAECQVRGALNRSGALANGQPCFGDPDHPPWLTEEDSSSVLGCLLAVGANYDTDEKQLETVLAALSDELAAPGACNEGFLRDDAALLVVLVTDEDDDDDSMKPDEHSDRTGSMGDPTDWYEALTAIKPASNVGVLALVADQPEGCNWMPSPGLSDGSGAEYAHRILLFLQHFTGAGYGSHIETGNICGTAGELQEKLSEVIDVLQSVCQDAQF